MEIKLKHSSSIWRNEIHRNIDPGPRDRYNEDWVDSTYKNVAISITWGILLRINHFWTKVRPNWCLVINFYPYIYRNSRYFQLSTSWPSWRMIIINYGIFWKSSHNFHNFQTIFLKQGIFKREHYGGYIEEKRYY